jgi:hypothetical protein
MPVFLRARVRTGLGVIDRSRIRAGMREGLRAMTIGAELAETPFRELVAQWHASPDAQPADRWGPVPRKRRFPADLGRSGHAPRSSRSVRWRSGRPTGADRPGGDRCLRAAARFLGAASRAFPDRTQRTHHTEDSGSGSFSPANFSSAGPVPRLTLCLDAPLSLKRKTVDGAKRLRWRLARESGNAATGGTCEAPDRKRRFQPGTLRFRLLPRSCP